MKRILIGVLVGVTLVFIYMRYKKESTTIKSSQLIEERIKNVSKLIVTEGYFSDIITYKDAKKYYLDIFTAEKKAVVLVKAKATISYDLKKIDFDINEESRIITIKKLPEAELNISPDLTYYDMQQDYLNPFESKDYNKISELVDKRLKKQISNSKLITNAENRLVSELHNLLNTSTAINWTIQIREKEGVIDNSTIGL